MSNANKLFWAAAMAMAAAYLYAKYRQEPKPAHTVLVKA